MSIKAKTLRILATLAIASLVAVPSFAQRGSANFTKYVAIGDSLTAGYTNGSLVVTRQVNSYPAVIARQTGVHDFQQPLISEPGIPPELQLVSLFPRPVIAPKAQTTGQPINIQLPRPYDNLGIPGARIVDLLTQTGAQQGANPFFQIVLRGIAPAADQALALHPTFISVWVGNNDVLGAVIAGTPAALTPTDDFVHDYTALLDRLVAGAPNAGMVTATVPPVTAIPYATTIPPVIINPATNQPVTDPNGNPIFYFAELGGGEVGLLTQGSQVTLGASSFLATGYGIPPALAPMFPNYPNAGQPLPDAVTLTASEVQAINLRNTQVNDAIKTIAQARNIPVMDSVAIFNRYRAGVHLGGITLSTAFLTGGVISYDGVHPTDLGYTLLANELIRLINESYDVEIPFATLMPFFQNNATVDHSGAPIDTMNFDFTEAAWKQLLTAFEPPAKPRRGRIVAH